MSFYSLSDSTFTRLHREEVDMAFSALDCILNDEKAVYASTELTSGLRLYTALREFGVKTTKELTLLKGEEWYKKWHAENIFGKNAKLGKDFALTVRERLGNKAQVINPSPFSARNWTQSEYLAFWEQLLRTRIHSAWFNLNWQYSNGCTFEFAVSVDAGIPTLDHQGNSFSVRQGADLIQAAIRDLESSGFDILKLRENLSRLQPVLTAVR